MFRNGSKWDSITVPLIDSSALYHATNAPHSYQYIVPLIEDKTNELPIRSKNKSTNIYYYVTALMLLPHIGGCAVLLL